MKYKIICDSSCDLESDYLKKEYNDSIVGFEVVPFIINVDSKEYIDDGTYKSEDILDKLNIESNTHTSCPTPYSYSDSCSAEYNIIITISRKLSGSFNSANTTQDLNDNKVIVIDSKGTGGVEQLLIDKAYELIHENLSFEELEEKLNSYRDNLELYFSLSNFDNLVRKGRIKQGLANIIKVLRMNLLCKAIDGEISLFKRCISLRQSMSHIQQKVKERHEKTHKCVITYTDNLEDALNMKEKLLKLDLFEKITIVKAKALNSFYALRKGLIVSF